MIWKFIKFYSISTLLRRITAIRTLCYTATLCLFLTSCGFRPLYTPGDSCGDIVYPIKIATIFDRNGQVLRNFLVDLLTPQGAPIKPRYILEITLVESVSDTGINRDETTSRKQVIMTANITLRDAQCNTIVYCHSTKAINSFPVLAQNYFSDYVAQDFAKKEAIRLLAEKITLFVTAYIDGLIPRE